MVRVENCRASPREADECFRPYASASDNFFSDC